MKRSVLGWLALFGCTEQSDEMDWDTAVSAETGGGNPTETGSDSADTGVVQDTGQSDAEDIEEAVAFTVHVAPWGDDNDLGTEGAPLATLEGARDAIRSFKNAAEIQGSLVVVIHAGTYTLDSTFELNAQDSGTEDAPIHYRSAEGSVVRISGGRALAAQDFVPVSNSAILDRLVDSSAKDRLTQYDLASAGISDFGQMSRRGYNLGWSSILADPPMELIIDDVMMPLARWPNDGSVTLNRVVDPGPVLGDSDFWTRGGTFGHDLDRMVYWSEAEDIWLEGTVGKDWEWTHNQVASFDVETREMTLAYGEVSGLLNWAPFFVFRNLLEEIDEPGEYFIDRETGVLYLFPPDGFDDSSRAVVSTLQDDLVRIDGADHISFENLIFEDGREHGIHGENANGLVIRGCLFRNLGMDAVRLIGTGNRLTQSTIHGVGARGVFVGPLPWGWPEGGMYDSVAHQNEVSDNVFEDFGRLYQAYYPAIDLDGVGTHVRNNQISDGAHMGIQIRGNDHWIEYNEISQIGRMFKDIGAIYANLGKHPGERGTLIRRNYIHHLGQDKDKLFGVYLDNGTMGVTVEENLFYAIGSEEYPNSAAVMSNHGQHIVVRNNMMVDTVEPFRLSFYLNCDGVEIGWGCADQSSFESAWAGYFSEIPTDHSELYAALSTWNQESHWEPTTNRYHRNLIFNPAVARAGGAHRVDYASADFVLNATDNWVASSDPGFVDWADLDFNQLSDAEMFQAIPGLRSIDFDRIGPGGWGSILDIRVRADAFVAADVPSDSYGGSDDVRIQRDRRQWFDRMGLFQVDLSSISEPIEQAVLMVNARIAWADAAELTLFSLLDDEWNDTTQAPSWNDCPQMGEPLDTARFFGDRYAWVEFDVTDLVQSELSGDGVVSLALRPAQEGLAQWMIWAREKGPEGASIRSAFVRVMTSNVSVD